MRKILGLFLAITLLVSPISINKVYADMPSEFVYTVNNSMATITGYTGSSRDIIIPEEIEGYPVTGIGNEAFRSLGLTSVTIPEGVITIGSSAFHSNQLTSVTIPDSVTSISDRVFTSNNIGDLVIPEGVTSIGDYAFSSNNLSTVTFSDGVRFIGDGAFFYNQLTSVSLPSNLTSLNPSVFMSNKLTNLTIPDGVTSIGSGAFHGNELISVTIPDSVTTIGENAFSINELLSVTIPNSVINIGRDVFSNNELTSITLPSNLTEIGFHAFGFNKLTNVTIPASVTRIDSYAFASNSLDTITFEGSLPSLDESVVASQTKKNYTFGNWYSDETWQAAWDFTRSIDANTTLYSQYIPNKFTVSFNSNGGSQVVDVTDVSYDTTITAPVAPTKSGYAFGGWYVDQALTTAWNFNTEKVIENTTLYAKWNTIYIPPFVPPYVPPVVEEEIEDTEDIESENEPEAPVEKYFTDTDGHWAENSINSLAHKGILKGYDTGQFGPNDLIQRHHLILLIHRLVTFDPIREVVSFEDVPTTHPSYSAILNLQQGGVIDGYKNLFHPSGQLTIGELAKILVHAFQIEPAKNTGENQHWSYIYTQPLSELEILEEEDLEDGVNQPVTRALLADILYRLLQYKQLI